MSKISPRPLLPAFAALALVGGVLSRSEARTVLAPTDPDAAAPALDDEGPLHEAMEGMQAGMRKLRKLLQSAETRDAALDTVSEMQASIPIAFTHVPEPKAGIDDASLLTWSTDFKRRILTLGLNLVELEEALLKEDYDAAKQIYGTLAALKKEGHDKYYPE